MISNFVRRIRPLDLLLPAGAALVSAGLQHLADREARQRARLDELAQLVDVHRDALAAAGVELVDELLVDERSPLDAAGPFMVTLAGATPAPEPEPERRPARGRGWKLAALALAGATAVTLYGNRGRIIDAVLARAGVDVDELLGVKPDLTPPAPEDFPSDPASSELEHEDLPVSYPSPTEPAEQLVDEPAVEPLADCGWPGCDWRSDPAKSETSQRTAAAVHRNRCTFRPAGAVVPGA